MAGSKESTPGTVRTGGRTARTREAVLKAALEELGERGFAGLSTARIADRAGVHRTTVHRRWPDHAELIAEALLSEATVAVPIPDQGNVRDDLRTLLGSIAHLVDNDEARPRIRALVADSARSDVIGAVVKRVWTRRFELGEQVVVRGIERGELRDDLAPETILALFTGPLYVRLLITGEPLDAAFLDEVVEAGLAGARRR